MKTTQIPFEIHTYSVGAWALPYLVNGDASGLEDGEQEQIEEWLDTAAATWHDADDNKWVYSHESINTENFDEFGIDEITGLRGQVYQVELLFRKES